jgi:hypothetical protein
MPAAVNMPQQLAQIPPLVWAAGANILMLRVFCSWSTNSTLLKNRLGQVVLTAAAATPRFA